MINAKSPRVSVFFASLVWMFAIVNLGSISHQLKAQQKARPLTQNAPADWLINGSREVRGIGVSNYTRFNPELSWERAIKKAITDLNSNVRILVRSYGRKIGRGPMRMREDYGITAYYDTTNIVPLDSVLWHGWSFVRIKGAKPVSDSLLYQYGDYKPGGDSLIADSMQQRVHNQQWLTSTGTADRLVSNLNKSIALAKQDALRQLAEKIGVQVKQENYYLNGSSHQEYQFNSTIGFRKVRIFQRRFKADTISVSIAVKPHDAVPLLNKIE